MIPHARRRAPWIALTLLLAIVACAPDDVPPRFYREDFETLCDGVPCGWQRSVGDADQATWVETIHPGEHGLRLSGEVGVRGPAAAGDELIAIEAMVVQVSARCDPGNTLRVDLVLADDVGNELTGSAIFGPSEEWTVPLAVTPSLASTPLSGTVSRVIAVGIAKSGGGVCEISELAIDEQILGPGC